MTRRSTLVGSLGAPGQLDAPRAAVDASGRLAPRVDGWTLDWWIGADDRWHLPAQESAVRQRLIDDAPVVETAMRIPGGDAVHRAFAVRTADGADAVVVEIENATPIPFAVALAVRPEGLAGPAPIHRIELRDTTVAVDGRPSVVLPRPPNRSATSTAPDADLAQIVLAGEAGVDTAFSVTCASGAAQAAVIYPLPHTATLRVLVLLDAVGDGEPTPGPADQASATQVASGWRTQVAAGADIVLPPGRLADAAAASRRFLLLAAGGTGPPPPSAHARALVAGALDRWGFGHDAATLLAGLASADDDGALVPPSDRRDSEGAALVAVADHVRLTDDDDLLAAVVARVADAAGRIRRAAGGSRLRRRAPLGVLAGGAQPSWLGPGRYYRDDLWAVAGLRAAAELLDRAGQEQLAATARADAASLWRALPAAFAVDATIDGPAPAGPDRPAGLADDHPADPRLIANLVACHPLGLLTPTHPLVEATAEAVRRTIADGTGVGLPDDSARLSPELTLALAAVELTGGDPRALERLDRVVGWASPTWAWPQVVEPEVVEPDGGAGVRDAKAKSRGHHLPTTAAFLRLVRDLCVRDDEHSVVVLSVFPPAWRGQSVEVHRAPTRFGALSYVLRWHGERPAILWELDPHHGVSMVELRAPGLDREWVGVGLQGEALIGQPLP